MKIWITAYALQLGIGEADASHVGERMEVDGRIRWPDGSEEEAWEPFEHEGVDWHATRGEAVGRVREMVADRIALHRKAIAKLEEMLEKTR